MSKEYIEAFRDILGILSAVSGCEVDMNSERIITVKSALKRLESIDNATPSEALEEIKTLRGFNQVELNNDENVNKSLDIIEQALLKAQVPKQYLKWEDLEFKKDIKVKLNGEEYLIYFDRFDGEDMVDAVFLNLKENKVVIRLSNGDKSEEQFFNDLHLERVEE